MRTKVQTLLTLDEWAYHVQQNPWAMAQFGEGFPDAWPTGCQDVMYQTAAQHVDILAREEIAGYIATAERLIAQYLGFWPAPKYFEGEVVAFPNIFALDMNGGIIRPNGKIKVIDTQWKWIRSVGTQTLTAIEEDVAITYSDPDGDSIDELATITTTVAVPSGTTADEIAVFYTATDRLNKRQDEYEIRPITVSINATTSLATITAPRYLFVDPVQQLALTPSALDVTDDTLVVDTVDVYRRYMDTTQQGSVQWDDYGCSNPPCGFIANTACFYAIDAKNGLIGPRTATYNATTSQFSRLSPSFLRAPDKVTVSYLAGYPRDDDGLMHFPLARAVTMLSCSLMTKKSCGCTRSNQMVASWQALPHENVKDSARPVATIKQLDSRLGARLGAIEAVRILDDFSELTYTGVTYNG